MSTSKDNSRKLPQNCVYQEESDKKGNKKHQPSLYFFKISFPWDPSIASVSINHKDLPGTVWEEPTASTARMPQNLICKDANREGCKTALGAGLGREQGNQWSGIHHGGIKWHFMYRSEDRHESKKISEGLQVLLGQKVQKLAIKYALEKQLWWKSTAVQENKIIDLLMGEKYLRGLQLFNKGCLLYTSEGAISETVWVFTRPDSNCAT